MSKKGNCYKGVIAVDRALEQIDLPPETFFHCAAKFEPSNPLNAAVEAIKFTAWKSGHKDHAEYEPPPVARAFADWILIAPPSDVTLRLQRMGVAR